MIFVPIRILRLLLFTTGKKKLATQNETPNGFVPLIIDSSRKDTNPRHRDQIPILQNETTSDKGLIEFIYPNGTKVLLRENIDLSLLKAIVHLY
jgi:hypothetical protein